MFHEKVKETRVRRNMTQKQLADAAQIAVGSVSAYENGGKLPPVDAAGRIAAALGVSLDWLLNDAPIAEAQMPDAGCVGDVARAFVTLVQAGLFESAQIQYPHVVDVQNNWRDSSDVPLGCPDEKCTLTIEQEADAPIVKFLAGLYKMGNLVGDGTLDKDIFHTWLERELEKLDRIPLQKD